MPSPEASTTEANRKLVEAFWKDLERRDFDKVGTYFAEDGFYTPPVVSE